MNLKIKFYDVEHGSCTHIITPNNKHFLVDIGTKSSKSLCEHLKNTYLKSDSEKIDYLIITHPHQDHIEDLPNLYTCGIAPRTIDRPKPAFPLVVTKADDEKQKYIVENANKMHDNYNIEVDWNNDPINPNYNGGVSLDIFSPRSEWYESNDLNSYSNVIVLNYSIFKFVLTGDNPAHILKKMLENNIKDENERFNNAIKNATVLLAPHHGRDGEFCEEFVNVVNPLLTVFSDDTIKYTTQEYSAHKYRNKTRGVKWDNTDRYVFTTRSDGNITFTLNADNTWSINTSKEEY